MPLFGKGLDLGAQSFYALRCGGVVFGLGFCPHLFAKLDRAAVKLRDIFKVAQGGGDGLWGRLWRGGVICIVLEQEFFQVIETDIFLGGLLCGRWLTG